MVLQGDFCFTLYFIEQMADMQSDSSAIQQKAISDVSGDVGLMELYRQILEIASRKSTPFLIIDEAHLFKRNVFTRHLWESRKIFSLL